MAKAKSGVAVEQRTAESIATGAAAAPDMARVLLEMGCRWNGEWAAWECRCCGASVDGSSSQRPVIMRHRSGCELDVALERVGLR